MSNKEVVTVSVGIIIIYLLESFVLNEIDARAWQQGERLICVCLWMVFGAFWGLSNDKFPDIG